MSEDFASEPSPTTEPTAEPVPPPVAEPVIEREAPFQLRGSSFTMMVLKITDLRAPVTIMRLGEKVRQAPNFFRNAPIVLDLDGLPGELRRFDVSSLVSRLRSMQLIPVGVQGGSPAQQGAALAAGLPLVPVGRPARVDPNRAAAEAAVRAETELASRARSEAVPAAAPADALPRQPTLVITETVRSGRQIYAPQGDLVVTASVSPGAELLADGNIHVYGVLRGRALAGLAGDSNARIFCLSLEAEMVSIAGLYRVNEDIDPLVYKKAAQISLRDGYLCMDPF